MPEMDHAAMNPGAAFRSAEADITGDSWLDEAARMSLREAAEKFGTPALQLDSDEATPADGEDDMSPCCRRATTSRSDEGSTS